MHFQIPDFYIYDNLYVDDTWLFVSVNDKTTSPSFYILVCRKFLPAVNKESPGKEIYDSSSGRMFFLETEPFLEFDTTSQAHLEKGALEQNRSSLKVETLQKENVEYKGKEECSVSVLSPIPGKLSRVTSRNILNTGEGTCASDQKVKANLKIQKANAKGHAANLLQSLTKKIRITRQIIGKNITRKTKVNNCLEKNQSSIMTGCSEREFACKLCSEIFLSAKELHSHENRHTGDRPHICATCGRTYRYRSSLIQHSQMHLESHPYLCDICGHGFALAVSLRRHTMSRHSNERHFRCKECGRGFLLGYQLRQHMESHTGNRPNMCYLCGKSFSHRGNLKRHISSHSAEKQHVCNICGKAFNRKSNMEKHVVLHSKCGPGLTRRKDLRQHACLRCQKVFHSEKLLSRHELIHSSNPLISCDICSKTFTTSQYLQQHKVAHLEKQFKCSICSKMFTSEHFLTTHTQKYHASPDRVNKI